MSEELGQVNCYTCENCRVSTFTINLNTGTTPFTILCPTCKNGFGISGMYRHPTTEVSEAFYFPTKQEFNTLTPEMKEFVLHGAMLHCPLKEVKALRPNPKGIKKMDDWEEFTQEVYGIKYSDFKEEWSEFGGT